MQKSGTIIAVSGYNLRDPSYIQNPQIDEFILNNVSDRKRVLYIPTASHDNPDYCYNFRRVYQDVLGCTVDVLLLYSKKYSSDEFGDLLKTYDLIYVGGGNTIQMIRKWRAVWLDVALKRYYQSGWTLAGMSAGASCWFSHGITDGWKYCRTLGIIDYCLKPHYELEQKAGIQRKLAKKYTGITLGLADHTAFVRKNGSDSICVFRDRSVQEVFYKKDSEIRTEGIVLDSGSYSINQSAAWVNFQKVS